MSMNNIRRQQQENIRQLKLASTGLQDLTYLNIQITIKIKEPNITPLQASLLNYLFYETSKSILVWINKCTTGTLEQFQQLTNYTPIGLKQLKEYKELAKLFGIFKFQKYTHLGIFPRHLINEETNEE
jgi:hypothetical protein